MNIMQNSHNNNRITALDAAKGIGILFVILGHTNYTEPLSTFIFSFHMPLFFIISGMVFNGNNYSSFRSFLLKKVKSLLCPYLLFAFFGVVFNSVTSRFSGYDFNAYLIYLLNSIKAILTAPDAFSLAEINSPLWFVPCLFLTEIIYYFLNKIKKPAIITCCVVLLTVSGWVAASDYCSVDLSFIPFNFNGAIFSVGFFFIGNKTFPLLKKYFFLSDSTLRKKVIYAITFVVLIVITFLLSRTNGKFSTGYQKFNNGFLSYATGICGSLAVLMLSKAAAKITPLLFCGQNSFYLMGIHIIFFKFINIILTVAEKHISFIHKLNDKSFTEGTVLFLIVLILSVIFTLIYTYLKKRIIHITQKNKNT